MSYKRGPNIPWYVKRICTPLSAGLPKAIGIDEVYPRDGDPYRIVFAVMCNDLSTSNCRTDLGGKNHGAGIHLDEIPPWNFRYAFVGKDVLEAAEDVYEPTTRFEQSLNDKFYGDNAQVAGYNRSGQIRRGIVDRLSILSGADISVPIVRGADELGHDVRRRFGHDIEKFFALYPEQTITFTPGNLTEMNLTRHEQRQMQRYDGAAA